MRVLRLFDKASVLVKYVNFRFNFEDADKLIYEEVDSTELKVAEWSEAERIDAVFMWWDLDMDGSQSDQMRLSVAPQWMRNDKTNFPVSQYILC